MESVRLSRYLYDFSWFQGAAQRHDDCSKGVVPEPEARNDADAIEDPSDESEKMPEIARLLKEYRHEKMQQSREEEDYLAALRSEGREEEAKIVRLLLAGLKATEIVRQLGLKNNQRVWNVRNRYLKPFLERTRRAE